MTTQVESVYDPATGQTLLSYDQIAPEVPEWLWRGSNPASGFLPEGEAIVLVGKRGIGKGMLLAKLTGDITTGRPFPGEDNQRQPANVILATAEDDAHKSMAWRLRAAQADLTRVFNATDDASVRMPAGIPKLRKRIEQIGNVAMVVLDPFESYSDIPLTASSKRIRDELMEPLRLELAEPTGITLVCVVHVTKEGKTVGSGAIENVPRQVLKVERLRANPDVRRLYVEKSNIASEDAQQFYTIVGTNDLDGHVEFLDDAGAPTNATPPRERVLNVLDGSAEPLGPRAIAQASGVPYGNTRAILTRLGQEDGSGVFRPQHGLWWTQRAQVASDKPALQLVAGDAT